MSPARRHLLVALGAVGASSLVGCLEARTGTTADTPTPSCESVSTEDLAALLPESGEDLQRTDVDQLGDASLEHFDATAGTGATYDDGNDDPLDDYRARVLRFEENVDPEWRIESELNSIEFASKNAGVGVVLDGIGIFAYGPDRDGAAALLARSPTLSERCVETRAILPSKTRTPGTPERPSTATGERGNG